MGLLGLGSVAVAAATLAGEWGRLSDDTREGVRAMMIAQRIRRGGAAEAVPPLPGAAELEIARLRRDVVRLDRALDRFEAEAAALLVRTERERGRVLAGAGLLAVLLLGFGLLALRRPKPSSPRPPMDWETVFETLPQPLLVVDPDGRRVRVNAAARALPVPPPPPREHVLPQVEDNLRDRAVPPSETQRLPKLTTRECEIFHLLVQGFSNKEIGDRLFISEGTVKTHVNRMLRKLELKDRVQVLLYAAQHDLLPGRFSPSAPEA